MLSASTEQGYDGDIIPKLETGHPKQEQVVPSFYSPIHIRLNPIRLKASAQTGAPHWPFFLLKEQKMMSGDGIEL